MDSEGISPFDGTYGRKLFYEAQGYTVTECYNQRTDNNLGGYTFAKYKAEIDAGHPVMLNLDGHTIVGVGYDISSNNVYIHDTWDYQNHTMNWGGSYDGMSLLSVSIVNITPTLPGPFTKSAPANGATNQSITPTLYWTASSGAISYQYCLNASHNTTCDGTWKTASGTSAPLSDLNRGTYYNWQVRASNANGTTYAGGSLTSFWGFTTKPNQAPIAPSTPIPANSSGSISTGVYLGWTASDPDGDALKYDVYLDEWSPDPTINIASDLTTTTYAPALYSGTRYYWKVVAKDAYGGTTSSPVWSFTTAGTLEAPLAFAKSAPASGATGVSVNATLSWADSLHASTYELSCYLKDTTTLCPGLSSDWQRLGHVTSFTLSGLSTLTTYTWQVRGLNDTGTIYADGSDTGYTPFTTQDPPPAAFAKLTPVNGVTGQETNLALSWQVSTQATAYEYCIDATNDGLCASWQSAGTATSVPVSGLTNAVTYYWQVRARNNTSEWVYADSSTWYQLKTKPYFTGMPFVRK
jgi:hypothetical protein